MSWKICSLSDVCSVLNGSTPSRKNREYIQVFVMLETELHFWVAILGFGVVFSHQ
jgi:hypothetical protein